MYHLLAHADPTLIGKAMIAGAVMGAVLVALIWSFVSLLSHMTKQPTKRRRIPSAPVSERSERARVGGLSHTYASEHPNRINPQEKPKKRKIKVNGYTYFVKDDTNGN